MWIFCEAISALGLRHFAQFLAQMLINKAVKMAKKY